MTHTLRMTIASLAAASALVTGAAMPAHAAVQNQDGLVNVAIGDITLQDINVGVAAGVAATVCGVSVGPVAVLGRAVDRSGGTRTVCETASGPVILSQN